jgi:hemerythrin-like domain-containing protein
MTGTVDLLWELSCDHHRIEQIFDDLIGLPVASPRRRARADEVTLEFAWHTTIEEQLLYPLLDRLSDGEEVRRAEQEEILMAHQALLALAGLEPDRRGFDSTISSLMTVVRRHIAAQEYETFPTLRRVCGDDELRVLGQTARRIRDTARLKAS